MGKSGRGRAAKATAVRKPRRTISPFRFLDLPPEVRNIFYEIYFCEALVKISSRYDDETVEEVYMEDFGDEAYDQTTTDLEGVVNEIRDEYDKHLIIEASSSGLKSYTAEQRATNWCSTLGDMLPAVDAVGLKQMAQILQTCRQIREEGQPILAASTRLMVFDEVVRICDLPQASVHLFLCQIQVVSLSTKLKKNARHQFNFDFRQMPNLKKLHLMAPRELVFSQSFSHQDVDELVEYVFGARNDLFLTIWSRKEKDITLAETMVTSKMSSEARELATEKNQNQYWLRDMLHDQSKRGFKVIQRMQFNLRLQLLKPSNGYDEIIDRTAFVKMDLDFDVDTKKVLRRNIAKANLFASPSYDLNNKKRLREYVLEAPQPGDESTDKNVDSDYGWDDDDDDDDDDDGFDWQEHVMYDSNHPLSKYADLAGW